MPKDQQDKESSNSHGKIHPLFDPAKEEMIKANLRKLKEAYSSGDPQIIKQTLEEMPGIKKLREQEAAAARNSRDESEMPT